VPAHGASRPGSGRLRSKPAPGTSRRVPAAAALNHKPWRREERCNEDRGVFPAIGRGDRSQRRDIGCLQRRRGALPPNAGIAIQCGERTAGGSACQRDCSRLPRPQSAKSEINAYIGPGANRPLRGSADDISGHDDGAPMTGTGKMMPAVRTIGILLFALAAGCAGVKDAPPRVPTEQLKVDPSLVGPARTGRSRANRSGTKHWRKGPSRRRRSLPSRDSP